MKVSVIIPVYNVLPYLQRCLDSVISQTLRDIEIIIVDDGSTDGSSEFVDEYALKDERIKVIHKENGGLMSAWTTGVRASNGDYIGFVDSDDYISLEMYDRLYSAAAQYNADIVICNYSINHSIEGKLKTELNEGCYTGELLQTRIKDHVFPLTNTYSIPLSRLNKLFRRKIVFDNLKYTSCLSRTFEDRYFVPATILSANSIYCIDDALYYWIIREGSNHGMYKPTLLDDMKRYYQVQRQIINEKSPDLLIQWELSFFDGIKQYAIRNIVKVKSITTKFRSAKILLKDEMVSNWIDHYGDHMNSKLGKLIYYSHHLRAPWLLAIGCHFGGRIGKF